MKCQECSKQGVSPFQKAGLLFAIHFRCKECGTEFGLNLGLGFLVSLLVPLSILAAVIYSFAMLSTYTAYLSFGIALVLLGVIVIFLPVSVKAKVGKRYNAK